MYARIHTIEPFDAAKGGKITFSWAGNQIHKVHCIIKENKSGEQAYSGTIDTMKSSYEIPANTNLKNGTYYVAYITVSDIGGNESSIQKTGTPFYCFSTPIFQLSISEGNIIHNSSFPVTLDYQQAEGEPLNDFTISLYSHRKSLLQRSAPIYYREKENEEEEAPNSYTISGLENATQYYLQAKGTTTNGMQLKTDEILFTVAYQQAQIFSTLELNNRADIGAVEIRSNIISTKGESEGEVVYIDNQCADLRDNSVTFDVGYCTKGDFSKAFLFYQPKLNQTIITFSDQEKQMSVNIIYREGTYADSEGKKACFELQAAYGYVSYIRFSNYIDIPTKNQLFALCITRQDHYYDLKTCLVEKEA